MAKKDLTRLGIGFIIFFIISCKAKEKECDFLFWKSFQPLGNDFKIIDTLHLGETCLLQTSINTDLMYGEIALSYYLDSAFIFYKDSCMYSLDTSNQKKYLLFDFRSNNKKIHQIFFDNNNQKIFRIEPSFDIHENMVKLIFLINLNSGVRGYYLLDNSIENIQKYNKLFVRDSIGNIFFNMLDSSSYEIEPFSGRHL